MPRTIPQRGGPSGLKRSTAGPSSSSSSALRAQTGGKTAFGRGKTTLGAGSQEASVCLLLPVYFSLDFFPFRRVVFLEWDIWDGADVLVAKF